MQTTVDGIRQKAINVHDDTADEFRRRYEQLRSNPYADAFTYGRAKLDRLLDDVIKELPPNARILDIGCGTGEHLVHLKRLGFRIAGIEPAPAMLAEARSLLPDADLRSGVATDLPFEDGSFDLCLSVEVLRYLHPEDIDRSLTEMQRVLAPGGKVFVTLVNAFALDGYRLFHRFKEARAKLGLSGEPPHCEFYTPERVQRDFLDAGFAKVTSHGRLWAPMRFVYKINNRLGEAVARRTDVIEDMVSSAPPLKRFAGHLVAVAEKGHA